MESSRSRDEWLFVLGLSAAVVALYWTSLDNGFVFDDARLADGSIFGVYGSLQDLRPRWLSYGSFVWVQQLLGENWTAQRLLNVALHLVTVFATYRLLRVLLEHTQLPPQVAGGTDAEASRLLALRVGVALFALNPVAVYAVAYLVQRSIVMATMFVALACLCFVLALTTRRVAWLVPALVCYLLAVLSKEHAVGAIALAVPLYVFVRRPPARRIAIVAAAAGAVLAAAGAALYQVYGGIIGTVFDETSRAYVTQLEQLSPGVGERLHLLSVVNQATLFFRYGFLWFVPIVTQMSIDLRPAFPLSPWTWPHVAGALGYAAVVIVGAWLVLRRSDALGLLGLCLLFPALMFATEFATVWVQDPFVLYRSYLWALPLPALVALPLMGLKRGALLPLGFVLAGGFAALSFERLESLQDAQSAWTDAAAKLDLKAPANAVGRWRPLLNLGSEHLERGAYDSALRNFAQAESLGEPLGSARYSMGVTLQQMRQHERALAEFALAEAKGFTEAALYYHRGESQFALGRFADAHASFGVALTKPQVEVAERETRLRHAEAAVASGQYDAAITQYRRLIEADPRRTRYQVGLAMAYVGKRDLAAARAILDPLIERQPDAQAYYARALALYFAGDATASRQDLELALRAEPANPQFRALRERLETAPLPSGAASKP
ncbi:MAG: tetratricopeptide repeat protein [Rubrivivax sp.]|nr:tetratricopeptide repeat protein [Rubrivivax sp.]